MPPSMPAPRLGPATPPRRHGPGPSSSVPTALFLLALLTLACAAPTTPPAVELVGRRPNIVLVYSDDHAVSAVGAYGSELLDTPHMDRLAEEGVLFENAFCTNSICAPARAVVLTGKHSHVNGVLDNRTPFDGSQWTFPQALQAAGYETALIGKWHLKSDPTGFDHWEVLPGQGHYYSPDLRGPDGTRRVPGYVTDVVTDRALDWLDDRDPADERPFLLMVQHKAPHRTWMPGPDQLDRVADELPLPASLHDDHAGRGTALRDQEMSIGQHLYDHYDLKLPVPADAALSGPDRWAAGKLERMAPDQRAAWEAVYGPENDAFLADPPTGRALVEWQARRYLRDYLRTVAGIDDNLGRLLDDLDARGLANDTLVIYTSDQGFFLGEHGFYDKRLMDEPSLRLPLILRWPAGLPAGRRPTELVQNLDIAPTLLELAGVPVPADVQGTSLLGPAAGPSDGWRESIYYEYFELGEHNVPPHHGVRTDRHKLIHWPTLGEWELLDLETDPDELHSVWGDPEYAQVQRALEAELVRLRREVGAPDA